MTESVTPSLLIGNGEEGELKYISESLSARGVEFLTEKHRQFVRIVPIKPVSGEAVFDVIGETVCSFYKFRELEPLSKDYQNTDYEIYALIGALMSVEKEEELRRVRKAVRGEREIALKTLVDFRLEALKEGWSGFLTVDEDNGIEVFSAELIKSMSSENEHVVPRLTENADVNAVVEVVRSRPTHVVVKEKERLSEKLLNTLRSLGE